MADVLITPESSSIEIKSGSNNAFGATIGLNGNRLSFSSSAILFTGSVSFNQITSSVVLGTQVAEKIVTFTPLTGSLTGGTSWYRIISGSGIGDYGRVRMNTLMDNSVSDIEFHYGVRNYDNLTGSGAFVYINRASTYNNVFNAVRVIESGPNLEAYAVDVLIGNYLNNTTPTTITCLYESQNTTAILNTPVTTSVSNTGSYISKTVYAYNSAGANYIGPAYSDGAAFAQAQGQVVIGYRGNYYYTTPAALNYSLLVSGSVGVGTNNPLNKLSVIGAASIGSVTYNTAAPTNGLIVEGNVGIGTTNPSVKFEVSGSSIISNPNPGASAAVLLVQDNGTATSVKDGTTLRVVNDGSAANYSVFEASSGASNFVILNSGNVGVGTISPNARLEVSSSTVAALFNVKGSAGDQILFVSGSGQVGINGIVDPTAKFSIGGGSLSTVSGSVINLATLTANNGNISYLKVLETRFLTGSDWTTATTRILKTTDVTDQSYIDFNPSGSAYGLAFGTGTGTPIARLVISASGNVGVGTLYPNTRFHVSGSSFFQGFARVNITQNNTIGTSGGTGNLQVESINIHPDSTTETMYVRRISTGVYQFQTIRESTNSGSINLQPYGGTVGIGSVSPTALLELSSSTASSLFNIYGGTLTPPILFVSSSGRIGLGNSNPTYGLYVNNISTSQTGTVYINAALNSGGKGLVIDSNTRTTSDNSILALEIINRAGTNTMAATVEGNVGIGTTVPTGSFHIDNGVINIPVLNLGGGIAGNDISDLYVLNTANTQSGAGFAAKVIGVNISASLDGTNRPVQRTLWGGVTSATALVLSPDDPNAGPDHGAFSVWTTSDANSGSLLTPKFSLRSAGNVGVGSTNPINKLDVAGNISASTVTASLFFGTSSWAQTASALPVGTYGITSSWATNAVNVTGTITNALTASNFAGYPIVRFSPALDINQSADANTYYYLIGYIGDNNGSFYVKGLIGGHDLDGGQGGAYVDLAIHSRYVQKPIVGTIYGNVGAQDLMVFASQSAVGPTSGNLYIYLKSTIYGLSELQYMGTNGSAVYYNPSVSTSYPGGNLIFSASAYDTQVGGFSILNSNHLNSTSSYSAALTSLRNGWIGIGTTSPNGVLQIVTSSAASANHLLELTSGFQKQVRFFTNIANGSYNPIAKDGDSGISFLSGSAGTSQNFFIAPWNSTIAGLYISGSGRIGIGTNAPLDTLHVSGGIVAGTDTSTAGSLILSGYYTAGALTTLGTEQSSGGPVLAYGVYPSSSVGTFRSATSIAIVRSAYSQDGGTHRWYLGPTQTVAIGSSASLSEVMRINTTGLGIGVSTLVNKLDVAGNISASVITASLFFGTSSWAQTSSWATNAVTVNTASWATNATTAHALNTGLNYTINNLNANVITASLLRPQSMIELYGLADVAKGITPTITAGSFNQGGPTFRSLDSYWSVPSSSVVVPYPTMSIDLINPAGANQISYVTFGTYYKSDTRFIPYSYRIDTSTDNTSWTNQVAVTTNTNLYPLHALSGEFRYIRLIILSGQTSASVANGYASQVSSFRVLSEKGIYTNDGFWSQPLGGSSVHFAHPNNIGIGTTNPQNKLSLIGSLNVGSTTFNTAAPTNGLLIEGTTGIGVTNPAAKLHVQATGGSAAAFLSGSDPAAAVSNAYIYAPVGTGFSSLPVYRFWYQNAGISNPASETVAIATTNTERLRVTSDGRVGIGTTTANIHTVAIVSGSNTSIAVINGPSARSGSFGIDTNGVYIQNSTNGDYFDLKNASGTARFRIVYDTHTLINTTYTNIGNINNALSGSKLSVFGNLSVGSTYGSNVAGPSNGLIVEGNVGIGVTNPANKLDVLGNISASIISSSRYYSAVPASFVSSFSTTGSTSAPGFTFELGSISQSHQPRGFIQVNDYYNSFSNGQNLQLKSFSSGVNYGGWMLMSNWGGTMRIGATGSSAYNANELPPTYMEVTSTAVNLVGLTLSGTASWASNINTASWANNALSSSWSSNVNTASWSTNSTTAHALNTGLSYTVTSLTANSNVSASATGSFGRVGVGTNNPVGTFDARPDTAWPRAEAVVIDTDGNNNPRLKFYRPDGGSATSSYATHLVGIAGGLHILGTKGSTFALGSETITSSLMFISSSGNVGIGVSASLQPLGVGTTVATTFGLLRTGITAVEGGVGPSMNFYLSQTSGDQRLTGDVNLARITVNPVDNWGGRILFLTKTADGVNTNAPTERMRLSEAGNLGIGTTNPSNPLTVIGAASIGSTTYNTTAPTNGLIVEGRVGIATSSPAFNLHVAGGGPLDITSILSSHYADGNFKLVTTNGSSSNAANSITAKIGAVYSNTSSLNAFVRFHRGGGATDGYMSFSTNSDTERMRIDANGNVGIGTVTATAKLNIASTSQTTKAIIQSVSAATGLGGYLAFNPGGDPTYSKVALGVYDSYYGSFNRGNLAFMLNSAADGTEVGFADTKMYISASGNVGIGTTTPFSKLDIITNVSSSTVLQAQGTNGILFSVVDDLSDSLMSVNDASGLPIFEVFADDRIVAGQYNQNDFVLRNNSVGIGTNNPTTKLHISSSNITSPLYIQTPSATNLLFVSSSGNIGIGTSNPAQRLDVRGYVVSDVNGNGVESGYYLGSSAHGVRRAVGTNDVYLYTTTGTLYLGTTGASTQQLTLLNGGNFGVGVTNPVNKLDVAGNISASALTASLISSSNINISQTLGVGSSVTIGSTLSVAGASTFSGKVGIGSASPVALFDVVTGSLNPAAKFVGLVGVGGAPATTNIGQIYILGPGSGSTTFPFKFDAVAMDTTANSTGKALKGWLKAYITNVSGFVDGTTYYIPVYV